MSWTNQENSIWDDFEEVQATPAKNDYVPAELVGHCTVVQMKTIISQRDRTPIFICSFATTEDCTLNGEPLEKGTVYDWVAKAEQETYKKNIKRLVMALNPEADPRSFNKDLMVALTGPKQPAKGAIFRIRTEQIKTTKGLDFTKCHYYPAMSS